MQSERLHDSKGFTLIELMIVVVVVAVLLTIMVPAYQGYMQRSKRGDAITSLLRAQLAQEQWRGENTTYGALSDIWSGSDSLEGYYTLVVASNTASSYRITAAPQGSQAGDSCGTFAINQDGPDYSGSYADRDCWGR